MFQQLALHLEVIFCLLTSPKCVLGDAVKVIFQVFPWHFELTFCFLTSPKYDLGEFQEAMF